MAKTKKKAPKTSTAKVEPVKEISIDIDRLLIPGALLISGLMISISVFLGIRSIGDTALVGSKTVATVAPTSSPISGEASTNVDDDAIKGNKDTATIAIVEFSDYECPFCKLFYTDSYRQLIQEYVDAGKAIYVFRDYIAVPSHNPAATLEAVATQCVLKYAGNDRFFDYHDYIFGATSSNGAGVSGGKDALIAKAVEYGIDKAAFTACLDDTTIAAEVTKDQNDALTAGVRGTPGFVIGKYNKATGAVDGYLVSGAQPVSAFQYVMEQAQAL